MNIQSARLRKNAAEMVNAIEIARQMNDPINVAMGGAKEAIPPLGSSLTKSTITATKPTTKIASDKSDSSVAHPERSRSSIPSQGLASVRRIARVGVVEQLHARVSLTVSANVGDILAVGAGMQAYPNGVHRLLAPSLGPPRLLKSQLLCYSCRHSANPE